MLITIKGVYDKGRIVLEEYPETDSPIDIFVTFTKDIDAPARSIKRRQFGFGKGTVVHMAPDFNEPLYDL
jgi:hypothetical protein